MQYQPGGVSVFSNGGVISKANEKLISHQLAMASIMAIAWLPAYQLKYQWRNLNGAEMKRIGCAAEIC
jgi:hypothetical protein